MHPKISDETFLNRAFKAYDNPHCISIQEFESDIQRFSHIKKILSTYISSNEINERLLLNHIVISFNLFGNDALIFLLYKVSDNCWPALFPFLIMLNRLPDYIQEFNLNTSEIPLDNNIIQKLRHL